MATRNTIITTHTNADFDALASMLAAQKIYPGARVVFPGSQDKSLRNFFINSMAYLYNMADIKSIELDKIQRLVLVDTRQPQRIGHFADVLSNPGLEIHIYDHHPAMSHDIKGQLEVIESTGATMSILTPILKERRIPLTADEATIMCLGIYEDTGSFTFTSTTEKDFTAAAYLLSQGANLNIIASLTTREISPLQVRLLNEMIQSADTYNINGVDVVLTRVVTDRYIPDFALLVHKLMRMENYSAVFAITLMENKIHLVARSRTPDVDVGTIVSRLGGGGHPFAASAAIKERTLAQVEQELMEELAQSITTGQQAHELMSAPVLTVSQTASCRTAANMLTRYNINALLVTTDDSPAKQLLGFITRQVLEKALFHNLGDLPVGEYMTTDLATVNEDAGLEEIRDKIIGHQQRVLPVLRQTEIVGVITRTDLLNSLVRYSTEHTANATQAHNRLIHARTRNIANLMGERLPAHLKELLKTMGKVAAENQMEIYVVGGFVRDLFLYRPNEDIDVVVEGDGIQFAKKMAGRVKARIHTHRKFGTAVVIWPDGFKVDVATARMEYYQSPAALPIIESSSIKLDLYRRDFTINTLAIHLNPGHFGTLIDFFAARRDIKEKAIRVLHNLSFVEDPTRAFRAIRFEQRFGFTIGRLTASLIKNAVKMDFFNRLSGRRVFTELRLILEEENPVNSLKRLADYNLLRIIHPAIHLDKTVLGRLTRVKSVLAWHDLLFLDDSYMRWSVYFMALMGHCDEATSMEICRRLELANRHRDLLVKERRKAERNLKWLQWRRPADNVEIYKKLHGLKNELILYMMAATEERSVQQMISLYYTKLRNINPLLRGRDLQTMGIPQGPIYREILDAILEARLQGRITTRDDEAALVKAYVR